jgi:hypothetical protein
VILKRGIDDADPVYNFWVIFEECQKAGSCHPRDHYEFQEGEYFPIVIGKLEIQLSVELEYSSALDDYELLRSEDTKRYWQMKGKSD